MPVPDVNSALAGLVHTAGFDPAVLKSVNLIGSEPTLPSSFAIGSGAQVTIAASAVAANEL